MADYCLLAQEYQDKTKMVDDIEKIANEFGCRIIKDKKHLYTDDRDIDIYFDMSEEDDFVISFWVLDEVWFKNDVPTMVNNKDYRIAILMTPFGDFYTKFGLFLKEFMAIYPNMIFCDESLEIFHTAEDVIAGKVSYLEED